MCPEPGSGCGLWLHLRVIHKEWASNAIISNHSFGVVHVHHLSSIPGHCKKCKANTQDKVLSVESIEQIIELTDGRHVHTCHLLLQGTQESSGAITQEKALSVDSDEYYYYYYYYY